MSVPWQERALRCPRPEFVWVHHRRTWTACLRCSRLAWDHEQADPLADIAASLRGQWFTAPAMLTEDQWRERALARTEDGQT